MGRFRARNRAHGGLFRRERGAVAILAGIALAVMVGFAGLALDLGRLYINKTELQSAADACALAASRELICDTSVAGGCPAQFLVNAEVAGISAAARNLRDMQGTNVIVAPGDVRFSTVLSPNSTYLSRTGGADLSSKFVMCSARSQGIVPWFMGVMGKGGANSVLSSAVATLAPSQNYCLGPPIGVCTKAGSVAPDYGYAIGEWIASNFTANGNNVDLSGNFKWVDFTPNSGGNSEINDGLAGANGTCDISVGDTVDVVQPGQQQGAKDAYNTRFGLYPNGANAYTPATAPPDRTGYAYPNKTPGSPVIGLNTPAYADYRARQGIGSPFSEPQYGVTGSAGNIPGNPITSVDHLSTGGNRRLFAVPFVSCNATTAAIVGTACVLMLNPMSNGATGTIYLEYVGSGTSESSPCAAFGSPSGPGGLGPMVPTLVQ